MNAATFQLQAAHLALLTLSAVVAERIGRPPAGTDRQSLDLYVSHWQDEGFGNFGYGDRRTKTDVLDTFDEAITRLEKTLNRTERG